MKHTPGPWKITEHSNVIRGNCSRLLINITGPYMAPIAQLKGADNRANARLVAAAPELFDALVEALNLLNATTDAKDEQGREVLARLTRVLAGAI